MKKKKNSCQVIKRKTGKEFFCRLGLKSASCIKKNHGEDSRDNPVSVINQFTQEKGDTSAREALASNHQIAT